MFSINRWCIRNIILLCNNLIVIPSTDVKGLPEINKHKLLALLYFSLATTIFIWSFVEKIRFHKGQSIFESSLVALEQLYHIILHFSMSITYMKLTLFKTKSYRIFLRNLWKVNEKIEISNTQLLKYLIIFLLFSTLLLVSFSYNIHSAISVMGSEYKFFAFKHYQKFQTFIVALMLFSIIYIFGLEFATIVKKLGHQVKHKGQLVWSFGENRANGSKNIFVIKQDIELLKQLIRRHCIICDMIDNFNIILGSHILLVVFCSFMNILQEFGFLASAIFCNIPKINEGIMYSLLLSGFLSILLPMATLKMLAWPCESTIKEAKKLINTCLTYKNQLPVLPKTENDELVKGYLAILCHQAESRVPHFSAAGYFKVDFTMLGMFAATLISNLVVLLQLIQNDCK